jgi:hypothetical protein
MNDHTLEDVSLSRTDGEAYSHADGKRLVLRTVDEAAPPSADHSKPVTFEIGDDDALVEISLTGDQLDELINTLVRISTDYDERYDRLRRSEEGAENVPPEQLSPEVER